MIDWKLNPEEMKSMSMARDLKAANYKVVNKKTGEISVEYKYTYSGTLELYYETGMEGQASIVHDDRGCFEAPSWNNETRKEDGPNQIYKSLEWGSFIRGGEYLKVFGEDKKVIWEGILFRDTEACASRDYSYHFLPMMIPYEDWVKWCHKEYRAEIQTNEPVLAEDERYIKGQEERKKEKKNKYRIEGDK